MTDPKGGKANIKKKKHIPNNPPKTFKNALEMWEWEMEVYYPPFQRKQAVKIEVSDYNSKPGSLEL